MPQLIGLTETRDLRSGPVPWREADWSAPPPDKLPHKPLDVAILGAGIMGTILADRLTRDGLEVALIDRRPPGCGSTAASTAQIMWAMDVPLTHLAERLGEEEAARRWCRVFTAVGGFAERLQFLDKELCTSSPSLLLTGDVLDREGLRREAAMRAKHGLPSEFLEAEDVSRRFGISPRDAIASTDSFEIDPVRTCHALLRDACERGARIVYPHDVVGLRPRSDCVGLQLSDGSHCSARNVILATGYERAPLFLPPAFSLLSTFVIATPPATAPMWRHKAMIWEAADPYLYVREGPGGRIIAGGEDIDDADSTRRDTALEAAAGRIAAKLEIVLGKGPIVIDRAWAATFGSSPDSLPGIGRSAVMDRVWISAGYGGNGIAFAALAAELIGNALQGRPESDAECFDPYRFSHSE